jgi:hypothetical protein
VRAPADQGEPRLAHETEIDQLRLGPGRQIALAGIDGTERLVGAIEMRFHQASGEGAPAQEGSVRARSSRSNGTTESSGPL